MSTVDGRSPYPRCNMSQNDIEFVEWEATWHHAGRPPMILEGTNLGRVRATSAYHGAFAQTDLHGHWRQRDSDMDISWRYYSPSTVLIAVHLTWNEYYDCWAWQTPTMIKALLLPTEPTLKKFIFAQAPPGWRTGTAIWHNPNDTRNRTASPTSPAPPTSTTRPFDIYGTMRMTRGMTQSTASPTSPASPTSTTSQWTMLPGQLATLLVSVDPHRPAEPID